MSAETSAWAKEQVCGDRTVKAVLREIANWARPDGLVEFLSVKRIAAVIEVSPRTVQRCIAQLEEPTLEHPGRLGLLRRVDRFRDDGGQSACGFVLLGYQPPMHVAPRDMVSPPHDIMSPSPHDILSGEPVTPVSPLKRDKILPPSDPDGSDNPQGHEQGGDEQEDRKEDAPVGGEPADAKADRSRGTRLSKDWTPPPIDELPPRAQALARQWPAGAYETEAEAFVNYWSELVGRGARKLDWVATWANRIVAITAKVLRDAKAGVNFAVPSKPSVAPLPQLPVAAKAVEDDRSAIMHNLLERDIGERTYGRYIKPAAITFDDEGVVMIFATDFLRSYVETNLSQRIAVVLSRVAKPGEPQFLKFIVEAPANRANLEAKAA